MSCRESRRAVNAWPDSRESGPPPPPSVLHAEVCGLCVSYARALMQIDAGLYAIADNRKDFVYSVRTRAVIAVPAVLCLGIRSTLPAAWQLAPRFLPASGAMCMSAVSSLRSRFIAENA